MKQNKKTDGKTSTESVGVTETQKENEGKQKEFYLVLSINEMKELIAQARKNGDKENNKEGSTTKVLRLYENRKYEGQLNFWRIDYGN